MEDARGGEHDALSEVRGRAVTEGCLDLRERFTLPPWVLSEAFDTRVIEEIHGTAFFQEE